MSLNNQTVKIIEEHTNEGHYVHYSFSVTDLVAIQPWSITWDFQTECEFVATSWRFRILFRQFSKKRRVSCSVSLKRRDSEKRGVKAFVWISFFDVDGRSLFDFPKRIYSEGILPGDEMHGSIGDRFFRGQTLYIGITIFIRCCHSESDLDHTTNVNTDDDRRCF
ncbi:hypothetical protein AVEN_138307-1 [Araneus ventricosus]|uniref:MATH domain-containing protein n=1 Tax=Araneus ventricosus TaxID=182803 RepID=A0A4Y2G4L7_ARAVE|nr:hypothetical protein AVEN_138307-1 [Araneus ventricosus]